MTRLIRVGEGVYPSINDRHVLVLCPLFASTVSTSRTRSCRNKGHKGRHKDERPGLVETLALGSVGNSTQQNYLARRKVWEK